MSQFGKAQVAGSENDSIKITTIAGVTADAMTTVMEHDVFPLNWTHNDEGVLYYQRLLANANDQNRDGLTMNLAVQYLLAGNLDSASILEEEVLSKLDPNNPEMRSHVVGMYTMLGVTAQRMGEVNNCRANHNSESCILPFSKNAVHTDKSGSRKAIEYYKKALELDSNKLGDRWLINICYMTLGEYPSKVPKKYFIDFNKYDGHAGLEKFEDIAPKLGVNTNGWLGGNDIEDFNNDGLLDLFSTSYSLSDHVQLFINDGIGGFIDKTKEAGLTGIVGGSNSTHVDYNNDGNMDIFIVRGGWLRDAGLMPCALLRNNGDGTFTDVTTAAGINGLHPSQSATWADVNNDGYADLFIGNERWDSAANQPSLLYINQRNGTFKEQSVVSGIRVNDYVKGVVFGDINNDGWQDLYITTFGGQNRLYINDGLDAKGQVHFHDIAQSAGVQDPSFSFPTAMFDFNNDGWEDLVVVGYALEEVELASEYLGGAPKCPIKLYLNNHDNTFTEVSKKMGIDRSVYAMGLNYADIDNDGFIDFYAGTGNGDFRSLWPNLMFKNVNGEKFIDVTNETGTGHLQKGHAVSFGDIDNDGDEDLFLDCGGFMTDDKFGNVLFQNKNNKNNWISIKLAGKKANRAAIGARIELVYQASNGKQMHEYKTVSTGGSFGANALEQKLGIGQSKKIISLKITWPGSGLKQEFTDPIAINHFYTVTEGDSKLTPIEKKVLTMKGNGMVAPSCCKPKM